MKGMILLANGVEDVEAIATIDILRRAAIQIDMISIYETKNITTSHQIQIVSDFTYDEIQISTYDFLILPGGNAVFHDLGAFCHLDTILDTFFKQNKLIGAICAAPILLNSYLNSYQFTCFKGCEKQIQRGRYQNQPVVEDKNLITAKSMYYTNDFALAIVKYLTSVQQFQMLKNQVQSK